MAGRPPAGRVPFVGLTGGIGAGKSEALAALARLGAATLSSDAVVHELLRTPEVAASVAERMGPEVVDAGAVDRTALAGRVFDRPDEREWLENLLWPRVGERIARWRDELDARTPRPVAGVVEVPLLFEAGIEGAFDSTVAIVADESVRSSRARGRDHVGLPSREGRQLSQEEKAARADHVVVNDGDLAALERGLSRFLATIGAWRA